MFILYEHESAQHRTNNHGNREALSSCAKNGRSRAGRHGATSAPSVGRCTGGRSYFCAICIAGVVAIVLGPLGWVGGVGMGPAQVKAAVCKRLEFGLAVVVDHGGAQSSKRSVVVLRHLCRSTGKHKPAYENNGTYL